MELTLEWIWKTHNYSNENLGKAWGQQECCIWAVCTGNVAQLTVPWRTVNALFSDPPSLSIWFLNGKHKESLSISLFPHSHIHFIYNSHQCYFQNAYWIWTLLNTSANTTQSKLLPTLPVPTCSLQSVSTQWPKCFLLWSSDMGVLIFPTCWFLFLMLGLWTYCSRCWNNFSSDIRRPHLLAHSGLCSNITFLERLTYLPILSKIISFYAPLTWLF